MTLLKKIVKNIKDLRSKDKDWVTVKKIITENSVLSKIKK